MLKKKDCCRLCESKDVQRIFPMPPCPPVDNFRGVGEKELTLPNFPMDLYMCRACGHAQLLDVVCPNVLYGNYIYTSSSSTDLDTHFTSYAVHVAEYLKLPSTAKVLDIGSNDGLLLSKFKNLGFKVVGIDPSSYVAALAQKKGIETIVDFFNHTSLPLLLKQQGKFDLVTANNVFSHADHLREFAECVRLILNDKGTFVFEVSYLKDLVDHRVIDYVYHEHLCHHSVKPLKQFLASVGLKLLNVERIRTKGGSIRCYAAKKEDMRQPEAVVEAMIAEEIASGLYALSTYQRLEQHVQQISQELVAQLRSDISAGQCIAAYGASATSTVLNALLKIDTLLSFIVDDNPLRQQRLSPGTLIPVLSSEALKKYKPKKVILSAWRFAEEIAKKNQDYLREGGQFVVPFPLVRIL